MTQATTHYNRRHPSNELPPSKEERKLKRSIYLTLLLLSLSLLLLILLPGCPPPPLRCPPTCPPGQTCIDPVLGCQPIQCPPTCPDGEECTDPTQGCQPRPNPLPTPLPAAVGTDLVLVPKGTTVTDTAGSPVALFQAFQCCRSTVTPSSKPTIRRSTIPHPRPIYVRGVLINTRWPCAGPEWMDFLLPYRADAVGCRLGPFLADAEPDFADVGGPYLANGFPNPSFWWWLRRTTQDALDRRMRREDIPADSWAYKYSQAGGRYVPFPQDVIDAFGHQWRPEFDQHLSLYFDAVGCFGNTYIALDNEGTLVRNYEPLFYRTMLRRMRELEREKGCGIRRIIGTSIPELFDDPDIDYTITHDRGPLVAPVANKWRVNNEHNSAHPPAVEEDRFKGSRNAGLLWGLWRDDMEDDAFFDTLNRFKRVVESGPPSPATCTLDTPTARAMKAQGRHPTIRVQKTTAGYDDPVTGEPRTGKWITGTPLANFGKAYYCQADMNWPEACATPPSPGPVAPDGHPQRLACEALFLEQPCPTFSMDHCTGEGEECPITFDTYIVIDGENQLHPSNVRAGCRESTYVFDPAGHPLSGEWWKATAHGKGYIKACNADGSVCGTSSFEIDY